MPPQYGHGFNGGGRSFGEGRRMHTAGDYHVPAPIGQVGPVRPMRSQHDSLVELEPPLRSPYMQTPRSPLAFEVQQDMRNASSGPGDRYTDGPWAPRGRATSSLKSETSLRYDSYSHLHTAASPLKLHDLMDDNDSMDDFSPPMHHSNNSSPNLHQDYWTPPDSRPSSSADSPAIGMAMEYRDSSASSIMSAPMLPGPPAMRMRGMTSSSAHTPTLHYSSSLADLGDYRQSNRTLPPNVYRPSRGPSGLRDSERSSARPEPFVVPFAEEQRSSVRSAWTAASSGFIGSERSSVTSRTSATSDSARTTKPVDDLILSVEDAINMYSVGFSDEPGDEVPANDTAEEQSSVYGSSADSNDATGPNAGFQDRFGEDQNRIDQRQDPTQSPSRSQKTYTAYRPPVDTRIQLPTRSRLQDNIYSGDADGNADQPTAKQKPASPLQSTGLGLQQDEEVFMPHSRNKSQRLNNLALQPALAQTVSHRSQYSQSSEVPAWTQSPISPSSFAEPPTPHLGEFFERSERLPEAIGHDQNNVAQAPDEYNQVNLQPITSPKDQTHDHNNAKRFHNDDDGYNAAALDSNAWPAPSTLDRNDEVEFQPSADDHIPDEFMHPRSAPLRPPPPIARDRYGFKKASQYITVEQYDKWNRGYMDYLDKRREKWEVLMKQYGLPTDNPSRFPPKTEKVKRYIRKGIPPEWRGAAWFWYAGGPAQKVRDTGLYQKLMRAINRGKLNDSDREHIERDLNRTFPDNIRFRPDSAIRKRSNGDVDEVNEFDTPIVGALRRVLQAFAVYNPNIGYCQSLNFLAGLLLLFLDQDEERTFIMLNVITSVHLPGTHAKVLEANVDIGVLMLNIKESMPAIWSKIDDSHDEVARSKNTGSIARLPTVSLATTAWFMSCFIGNLPIETVLRVWDVFFYEGSKALFRIALTIFKVAENDIKNVQEHMEVFQLVQTVPRRLLDANELMEACYKRRGGFGHISQETIDQRRVERRKLLAEERARKLAAKNLAQGTDGGDDERSGRLRRAASKARMKRNQSKKRPQITRPAPSEELFDSGYIHRTRPR